MIGAKQKMKHITVTLIILFTLQLFAGMSHAEDTSFWDQFKDPQDGQFDIIGDKEMATGFLPVVIPFNEPTIGLGAVGALAYFHPKAPTDSSGSSVPPSISFAGGLYSDNKTWSVAGGHMGVWDQGNTRYVGALVYASVNLDFYGIGAESPDSEEPIPYNIEGGGTIQQMEFRLGDSNFFAGTKYEFSSTYGTFNTDEEMDEDGRNRNAGLGIYTSYDTRDNIFTPNSGTLLKGSVARFGKALGGDFTYDRIDLRLNHFWPLNNKLILGLRMEYRGAGHGAPFYALPWVKLRGIGAFRYLGYHVLVSEIEPRWKIDNRWSLLAFGGVGRAASHFDKMQDAEKAYNYGAGFRYLVARRLGLAMGLDIARGPEETTAYLTVGNAW